MKPSSETIRSTNALMVVSVEPALYLLATTMDQVFHPTTKTVTAIAESSWDQHRRVACRAECYRLREASNTKDP